MMIQEIITPHIKSALEKLYGLRSNKVELQDTRAEFKGDITLIVFPYVKSVHRTPEEIGNEIGNYLQNNVIEIKSFNIVKGFLNLSLSDDYFIRLFNEIKNKSNYGYTKAADHTPPIIIEYSSPNTNKPLHLGHIRNNLLGYSVAEILKAAGKKVLKTQVINDRGIHICKSMLAWQKLGNGETPESSGMKGDQLVGKYYVLFNQLYKEEVKQLLKQGETEEEAKKKALVLSEAQEMLRKWESGESETLALWEKMNRWVYDGFEITYKHLGVDFDFQDYESNNYILGKNILQKGLEKDILYRKEDGSIWCDLQAENLDNKLLLRADGTAVYMTQDLGTAVKRYETYHFDQCIYTVGDEQNHHFKVLITILRKLGYAWADRLYHLSYGMVHLSDGSRMKSREGTTIDADKLIKEMVKTAANIAESTGKLDALTPEEKHKTHRMVGLCALKYFILKVDPKRTIKFNPEETIDFNGNTGPFIQYTYARICSLQRKGRIQDHSFTGYTINDREKIIFKQIIDFPSIIQQSAETLSPAMIANYLYDLVKNYNNFYQNMPILKEKEEEKKQFRLQLSQLTGRVIKTGMKLLGIQVPERM